MYLANSFTACELPPPASALLTDRGEGNPSPLLTDMPQQPCCYSSTLCTPRSVLLMGTGWALHECNNKDIMWIGTCLCPLHIHCSLFFSNSCWNKKNTIHTMRKTKNFNFAVRRSRTRSPRSPVVEEKVLDDGRWEQVSPHPPSYHYCINYLATKFNSQFQLPRRVLLHERWWFTFM